MEMLRRTSTIFIWFILTAYTLIIVATTNIALTREHYVNFILLGIAIVCFLIRRSFGQIATLTMLAIGFLGRGTYLPDYYFFRIGNLELAWIYLPLIIYFAIVNHKELPDWIIEVFGNSSNQNSND